MELIGIVVHCLILHILFDFSLCLYMIIGGYFVNWCCKMEHVLICTLGVRWNVIKSFLCFFTWLELHYFIILIVFLTLCVSTTTMGVYLNVYIFVYKSTRTLWNLKFWSYGVFYQQCLVEYLQNEKERNEFFEVLWNSNY